LSAPEPDAIRERLEAVRALLREEGLDAAIVRSTDRWLNEYVPRAESTREWLTGFSGSTGDALVTREGAWLAVDGRYYLQADRDTAGAPIEVERVPLGTSVRSAIRALVARLAGEGTVRRVAYEPDRFTVAEEEELQEELGPAGVELVPTRPSLPERARGSIDEPVAPLRVIPAEAVGASVAEKVAAARSALEGAGVHAFLVQRLDELAWVTNLRGTDLPYQATFRAVGLLFPGRVVVSTDLDRVPDEARAVPGLAFVDAAAWRHALPARGRVGYDPGGTSADALSAIVGSGAEAVELASPLQVAKAKKTPEELRAMQAAFDRADAVMEDAIAFVQGRVDAGEPVTEADLSDEIERLFTASGASGLSFRVIAAAGPNAANIHYSAPDAERRIAEGDLVLIDTGGYYAEGYATDLTRTFLAGSDAEPTAEQRRLYTLVLKAAVAGMSARLPTRGRGDQLDALVRDPLWRAGLDYNHGTGHGVGVNVHEYPPRVSTSGATATLEPGHVFSIEPGLYRPGFGGIRIENLCTIRPAGDAEGFKDVVPMTSAALDPRLIDDALLTDPERRWLEGYAALRQERLERAGRRPPEPRA